MRKILIVLLMPIIAFATQQTLTKFTGATLGSTDTIIASGNFTIDSTVSIGAFWMPGGTAYTLSNTGTNIVTVNNDGISWGDSSTGTKIYPSGIVVAGASGQLVIVSGSGAVTATSCSLAVNGTTAAVIRINKTSCVFKSWTIGASAIVTNSGSAATTVGVASALPLTISNNATFTSNTTLSLRLQVAGSFFSIGTGCTFAGTSDINCLGYVGGNCTVPAFTRTTGRTLFVTQTANSVFLFTGNVNTGAQNLLIYSENVNVTSTVTFSAGVSVTCGTMQIGSTIAGANSITFNFSSGTYNIAALSNYVTGPVVLNFGSSQWTCAGAWAFGASNLTVDPGTSTVTISNTATVTNSNKSFYNFIANASTKTITMSGKFRAGNNFTATAGSVVFGNLARDSVVGDWANNLTGTDTLNRNSDSLWLGGSFTSNLRTKNDLSCSYLYGTALSNFTCNTNKVNCFEIRGDTRAKQMKLIDRCTIRKLTVGTGTLNTNGMDFFTDSFLVVNDSIAIVAGDTISAPKITFGASAKPIIGTPMLLYFGLALADTLRDSITQTLGNLIVNKTGNGLTVMSTGHFDTVRILDGAFSMGAATDTLYCDHLQVSSTDTMTLTAPIVAKTCSLNTSAKIGWAATSSLILKESGDYAFNSWGRLIPRLIVRNFKTKYVTVGTPLDADSVAIDSGIFNEGLLLVTREYYCADSVNMTTQPYISGNLTFTNTSRPYIASPIYFNGTNTITSNGKLLDSIIINGTSMVLNDSLNARVIYFGGSGTLDQNNQGIRVNGNCYLLSTGVSIMDDLMEINGNITVGATSNITVTGATWKIDSGITRRSITSNGKSLPAVITGAPLNMYDGCTISRLSFGIHGRRVLFENLNKFIFTNVDSADWSGSSFALKDSFTSLVDSSRCTLDLPGNRRFSRMYWRDCVIKAPDTMTCLWRDSCRSGGGNY